MQTIGDYRRDGYAHVKGLLPVEVANAFLQFMKSAIGERDIPLSRVTQHPNLLKRAAYEVYGHQYTPMLLFLWSLTPAMSALTGRTLLPTYNYFRIYREGDTCRVHHDRYACEHSLSLTLGYSDDKPWPLEVEKARTDPTSAVNETFGAEAFGSVAMEVGDAVMYQGVNHRHGRVSPNPNRWSAHLFLHWVDKDGPHAEHAFDQRLQPTRPEFTFS